MNYNTNKGYKKDIEIIDNSMKKNMSVNELTGSEFKRNLPRQPRDKNINLDFTDTNDDNNCLDENGSNYN